MLSSARNGVSVDCCFSSVDNDMKVIIVKGHRVDIPGKEKKGVVVAAEGFLEME